MNKTAEILKAKLNKQSPSLSKEDLLASLIKSMAAQLNSEPEQEKKEAVAPLSKSQVESRLSRLDAAIENSNSHLMKSFLTAAREKTIRDNVPITISTNVQKSASSYRYSMGDMNLVVAHLKEKGASKEDIERALLYMAAQKQE